MIGAVADDHVDGGLAAVSSGELTDVARRAARSGCTILITGETGVGKGHLARQIHASSPRADQPFVPINCGAVPESLIDSQLFGHVRGSFTGATNDHIGLVRAAEGGTLFLDEISELPLSAQVRLLRLLQDREIQPVGRPRPVTVDVRVIAATNRDLHQAIVAQRFREDLLYRLDVIRLRVRPLRERLDDLPLLIETFNSELAALYGQEPLKFDRQALAVLRAHRWPGNVRQLRTVIERLHVLCPSHFVNADRLQTIGQLSLHRTGETPGSHHLAEVKLEAIRRVLAESQGSIARAAQVFGVHRSTIYRWLHRS
jgi:transcriptional regulator with PAS, ATPase and Fis domain